MRARSCVKFRVRVRVRIRVRGRVNGRSRVRVRVRVRLLYRPCITLAQTLTEHVGMVAPIWPADGTLTVIIDPETDHPGR